MISAVTDDCCATLGFSNGRLINSIIPPKFINWHTAEGNFFFFSNTTMVLLLTTLLRNN